MNIESHLHSLPCIGNNLENNLTDYFMMELEPEGMRGKGGFLAMTYILSTDGTFF